MTKNLFISLTAGVSALSLCGVALGQDLPAPAPVRQPVKPVVVTPPATAPALPVTAPAQPVTAPAEPPVTPPTVVPQPTEEPIIITEPHQPSVGGIVIEGLKDREAVQALRAGLDIKLQTKLMVWDGPRHFWIARDRLGATIPYLQLIRQARQKGWDVPLRFQVNPAVATQTLADLAQLINRSPHRARLDVVDGAVAISGGDGLQLSVAGSVQRVRQALEASPPHTSAQLVVRHTGAGAADDSLQQFRYLLASYSTKYPSIRGRTHNLSIAARNVDGTIVDDGAVFSTNHAIGPRNAADGWREAQMFVSGKVVSGVGAGICQCASTLYNAALLANLPIVERHPHMFRVTYVPASRDATIYWGSKDMKFRNDTGGPIYVQTFLGDGKFHVRLYGTRPRRHNVDVVAHTLSHKNGTTSEAYRIVETPEGNISERLSRDHYRPHP